MGHCCRDYWLATGFYYLFYYCYYCSWTGLDTRYHCKLAEVRRAGTVELKFGQVQVSSMSATGHLRTSTKSNLGQKERLTGRDRKR